MESNEQTELTSKIETYSQRAGWQLRGMEKFGGGGTEQKGKGLTNMDNSVAIVGGSGV